MINAHINLAKEYAMTATRRPSKEEIKPGEEVTSTAALPGEDELASKVQATTLNDAAPTETAHSATVEGLDDAEPAKPEQPAGEDEKEAEVKADEEVEAVKAPDAGEESTVTYVLSSNPHAKFSGRKSPSPVVTANVADATPAPASPRSPR
jgi:hypothetical protein